ncbi:MAG: hypothetical protein RR609_09110 [Aurantimicrobium sp.]
MFEKSDLVEYTDETGLKFRPCRVVGIYAPCGTGPYACFTIRLAYKGTEWLAAPENLRLVYRALLPPPDHANDLTEFEPVPEPEPESKPAPAAPATFRLEERHYKACKDLVLGRFQIYLNPKYGFTFGRHRKRTINDLEDAGFLTFSEPLTPENYDKITPDLTWECVKALCVYEIENNFAKM